MAREKICFILLIVFMIIFSGCTSTKKKPINVLKEKSDKKEKPKQERTVEEEKSRKIQWMQKSLDKGLLVSTTGKKTTIPYLWDFEDIDVIRFIDVTMTEVFKLNYIITDSVKAIKKKFSIKMTEDLPREKAFKLFQRILNLYDIGIRKTENVYVFEKFKTAKVELRGPFIYGRKVPQGLKIGSFDEITFLIPFFNIPSNKLSGVITKYLSPPSNLVSIDELNILVVNGRLGEIRYVLSLVNLLDRVQFKEKSIVMITPKYWGILDFSNKLEELLSAEGIAVKSDTQSKGVVLIPIENLNSILIISPFNQWAERVIYWLNKLDIPEAAGEAKKVYAYKFRNIEVGSIEEVLKAYAEEKKSSPSIATKDSPKAKPEKLSTGKPSGNSSIISVKETNSIVIIATPVEYQHFMEIIKKVDIPRNQVFVEAIVGEISLDKTSEFGLEFWMNQYLHKTEFGTKGGLGVYKGTTESGSTIIPSGSNAFIKGVLPGTQYEILLNALVTDSLINIISTPKITVLENESAEISVGAEIPVISSQTGFPSGTTPTDTQTNAYYYPFQSVNYVSTGIILKVKPAILSDNNISLEIFQEISEAQENKISTITSPEILKRTIKTTLIVQEGQIAFLGGLIRKKKTTGESGIPILSKIPILGHLFKKTSKISRKTELVVFINAKIIRRSNEMREIVEGIKKIISSDIYVEEE